jgi:hypothetical protein
MERLGRRFGRKRHAAYTFRYTSVQWGEQHDRSPMLPVRLSWEGKALKTKMLLDTGATISIIPPWIAEVLGLTVTGDPFDANGAGGTLKVRRSQVDIQVPRRGMADADQTVRLLPILVTVEPDAIPYGVLGRDPFFKWFEVVFRQAEEEVVLRHSPAGDED